MNVVGDDAKWKQGMDGLEDMKRGFSWASVLMVTIVLAVLYVLSSAPVLAVCVQIDKARGTPPKAWCSLYEPIILLIERTPLRKPIGKWFPICGAVDPVATHLVKRAWHRFPGKPTGTVFRENLKVPCS